MDKYKSKKGSKPKESDGVKSKAKDKVSATGGWATSFNRRGDVQNAEENLLELLEKALGAFPTKCFTSQGPRCDPHECDHTYDETMVEEAKILRAELKKFEMDYLPDLKSATSTRSGRERNTILHIMVNKWSGYDPWPRKLKQFLNWMLQQQSFRAMLEDQNGDGNTPVHLALSRDLHEFVNCILEAKALGSLISVLKKDSTSAGNCLHIAAKYNFANMKAMIDRFTEDRDVFLVKNRSHKDTPFHVAVKELSLLVLDEEQLDNFNFDKESNQSHEDEEWEEDEDDRVKFAIADFPEHNDDDDVDYDETKEDGDDDESLDEEELQSNIFEPTKSKRYRLLRDDERKERLRALLKHLEAENTRPRPPLLDQHLRNRKHHLVGLSGPRENFELPISHMVPLLVNADPEALQELNEANRTPYREREEALLNDPDVLEVVSQYTNGLLDVLPSTPPHSDTPPTRTG
ncbi:hypothetical protein F5Y16DRAFT_405748 [Xylariaceae sp. FL0255]|nr:hypothetical protein F5Y16DRAFT_405748 [Xylariaceae sp. FL0255]